MHLNTLHELCLVVQIKHSLEAKRDSPCFARLSSFDQHQWLVGYTEVCKMLSRLEREQIALDFPTDHVV